MPKLTPRCLPLAPLALARLLPLAGLVTLAALNPRATLAQRVVPKLDVMCPLGYVDLFNGKCSTLGMMTYTVKPTDGKPCPEGWMNVGGKYCRRK